MSKITLIALLITIYSGSCWAQEIYLEGVSVLGDKKIAYIAVDGDKVEVREGDDVASWKVVRIERRAVFLTSPASGEETELQLNTRLKLPEEGSVEPPQAISNIPVIKDEDVPEGYRKVKTPFGDYVILKDYSTPQDQTATSEGQTVTSEEATQTQESTTPPVSDEKTEQTPPTSDAMEVVHTPFGEVRRKQ